MLASWIATSVGRSGPAETGHFNDVLFGVASSDCNAFQKESNPRRPNRLQYGWQTNSGNTQPGVAQVACWRYIKVRSTAPNARVQAAISSRPMRLLPSRKGRTVQLARGSGPARPFGGNPRRRVMNEQLDIGQQRGNMLRRRRTQKPHGRGRVPPIQFCDRRSAPGRSPAPRAPSSRRRCASHNSRTSSAASGLAELLLSPATWWSLVDSTLSRYC